MNVTELARQLKVTTSELLEQLPSLGFDIGRRAIKVDDRIAQKIIQAWKKKGKEERERERIREIRGQSNIQAPEEIVQAKPEVMVPAMITVKEFAGLINLPVNCVLAQLMKNGVLTSLNERIDFDTAAIIGEELGFKIIESQGVSENELSLVRSQEKLKQALKEKDQLTFMRPPVVVVMGHVDHGKTKILDAIRKTDVVSEESGGITQHIGAYQVRKNDRLVTFIDTPGHEAFTAMRSRGARVADIAILVVAADDGVQPQTKEAIKIIQDAKLPFLVAINKIDKPEANVEKVKQDLAQLNLLPEGWGGKLVCVPISAKDGQGIDGLLETILLIADLEDGNLKSNPERLAIGTIIDSKVDKGEGPVATILVQVGTLKVGDILSLDDNFYGRVRSLKDYRGQVVQEAGPGTPVKILGLKVIPEVGSILAVATETKKLNKNIRQQRLRQSAQSVVSVKKDQSEDKEKKFKSINLIVKVDVLGSLEVILESLAKLETEAVKIKIVSRGLGTITEADVLQAEATNAKIFGFHVKPSPAVADLARDKKVEIKFYKVIYHLIEEVQKEIDSLKEEKIIRVLIGRLSVLKVFRRESKNMIIGGRIIEGAIKPSDTVIVVRESEPVASGRVNRLECAHEAAERVAVGQECGVNFEGQPIIEENDILEFYQTEKK